jgi:hypothetical protein
VCKGPSWQKEVIQECAKYRVKPNSGDNSGNEVVPFEMVVLDNALNATTNKFNKNLSRHPFNEAPFRSKGFRTNVL